MTTKNTKKRKVYKKKRYTLPVLIIVTLLLFRFYLPTLVKNYVNEVLAEIPGYYGQVNDIDIALYRGAYTIKGMYLNKVNAKTQVPFIKLPKTDISVEWKSLLDGEIVSEIKLTSPELIYVLEDQEIEGTEPDIDDWTKAITDLAPIEINNLEIYDGKLAFVQLETEPNIDLQFNNLRLTADNLRNVKEKERILPSPITATATSIGQGNVTLNGNMNIIKEIPDMDIAFSLESADVSELNPFTRHYAGIDFESGKFSLFSEIAIADGYFKGYMKPLLKDSKLIGKDDGILGVIWEGFVGFFKFVLKNQGTDTIATRVPLEGDLNNIKTGVFPAVFNIFENGWISAFKGEVDEDIEFKDAFKEKELTREERKEIRKADREKRRAEREAEKAKEEAEN